MHPVRWLDSLRYLLEAGLTTAVEIGPKNVLQYLLQAVAPDVLSCTYDKEKDVRKSERMLVVQQEDYPRIIAQCLAVVAGTRNRNRDGADYERRVVNPFRHVQNAWEERNASGLATSQVDVQEALQMMQTALEAKRVRQEERERHLRDVLGRKLLKIQA